MQKGHEQQKMLSRKIAKDENLNTKSWKWKTERKALAERCPIDLGWMNSTFSVHEEIEFSSRRSTKSMSKQRHERDDAVCEWPAVKNLSARSEQIDSTSVL